MAENGGPVMPTVGDAERLWVPDDSGECVLHASPACGVMLPSVCLPEDSAIAIGLCVLMLHGEWAVSEPVGDSVSWECSPAVGGVPGAEGVAYCGVPVVGGDMTVASVGGADWSHFCGYYDSSN